MTSSIHKAAFLPLLGVALLTAAVTASPARAAPGEDVPWRALFNGRDLQGWEQRGGAAKYSVKGGVIEGMSVPNTPNSFLCTKERFGDFVFEYEFKVDPDLNAGVQIRSNSDPAYRDGRVHGYQVEIDPDTKKQRFWTGGIYEEARRGWLADLSENEAARKAFKPGQWNHVRVEAVGDSIKTFVNGVPAADLRDPVTQTGFIALQVHDVGNRQEPLHIAWRNLRIKDLGKRGWVSLFDGKTLNGLAPLKGSWKVDGGLLVGQPEAGTGKGWGALRADGFWDDVVVKVVYRLEDANGGLFVRARPDPKQGPALTGLQADLDASAERLGGLHEFPGRGWVARPAIKDPSKSLPPKNVSGEGWTEVVLSAHGDRVVSHVNGLAAAHTAEDGCRTEGVVALEVFGGSDARIEVKELAILGAPIPPAAAGTRLGICSSIKGDALEQVRDAGFDFAEINLVEMASLTDEEFAAAEKRLASLGLPVISAIIFLPREIKVVGPDIDIAAQNAYFDKALPRAAKLGLRMVVFGSGRSRAAPEGFDKKKAFDQLVEFGRRAAQRAKPLGLTIVVESLQSKETNMINTSAESLELVKAVNHPNFKMLVDHYHMALMNEDPAIILKAGRKHIVHVQIANPERRRYPKADAESHYGAFFGRLAEIGYQGGVSIEGGADNFGKDAHEALLYLRRATAAMKPARVR